MHRGNHSKHPRHAKWNEQDLDTSTKHARGLSEHDPEYVDNARCTNGCFYASVLRRASNEQFAMNINKC